MDFDKILDDNSIHIVNSIDVSNSTLWERLIKLGLFPYHDAQHIIVSSKAVLKH